jgi:translation initiation factor 5
VLAELLFTTSIMTEVQHYRLLLLRFTYDDARAQRALLGGIEQVVALHKDVLLPKTALILKYFLISRTLNATCVIFLHF